MKTGESPANLANTVEQETHSQTKCRQGPRYSLAFRCMLWQAHVHTHAHQCAHTQIRSNKIGEFDPAQGRTYRVEEVDPLAEREKEKDVI